MSKMTLAERDRANYAWEAVKAAKEKDPKYQKGYRSAVRSGGADIYNNGLGQTLAFWYSRNKDQHYQDIYKTVSDWLRKDIEGFDQSDALTWITRSADVKGYRRVVSETIAFLSWLKRFAEAELESD